MDTPTLVANFLITATAAIGVFVQQHRSAKAKARAQTRAQALAPAPTPTPAPRQSGSPYRDNFRDNFEAVKRELRGALSNELTLALRQEIAAALKELRHELSADVAMHVRGSAPDLGQVQGRVDQWATHLRQALLAEVRTRIDAELAKLAIASRVEEAEAKIEALKHEVDRSFGRLEGSGALGTAAPIAPWPAKRRR